MGKVDYEILKREGFIRQKQKDVFSLRIEVIGGALTSENLKVIGKVADNYGAGRVHLTSRQSVEIPFIKLNDIEAVKAELLRGGCKPGVCGPRVRTVTACQGNEICPGGNIDTYEIALKLNKRYYERELPHKFKFGITGCHNNCLKAEENDMGIKGAVDVTWLPDICMGCGKCERVCRSSAITMEGKHVKIDSKNCTHCGRCAKICPVEAWNTQSAYIASFGGTFGNYISRGITPLPLIISKEQLFRVTDAAVSFFQEFGESGERFKFTIDRIGADKFINYMEKAYES